MRLGFRALPLLALGVLACSGAFTSSTGPSIVGDWSTPIPKTAATEKWFFDSDGKCGLVLQQNNLSVCGTSSCTYSFAGNTLTVTTTTTSNGTTMTDTYVETVSFSSDGNSATVNPSGCDGGSTCVAAIYTRIDSSDNHTCP
jgi:hypothetical protein